MAICRARALFSFSKCNSALVSRPFHSSPIRSFSSSQFESVGFIGLGNMGFRMVNNLIKAGYKVAVHDINCSVLKKFSDMGVVTKETPFEVAEASDVVITMLPSSSHVVLFVDNWMNPVMLDAPVSGGVLAAEAGTLTFMVGGSEEAYQAANPLFLSMGKNTIYCGKTGNGSAAKICNNLAMAVSMLGVSEALALGQSLGIAANTLTRVFNSSSARCWSSDSYNPVPGVMEEAPSSRNYDGGFASKLMAKDLNLAASSAEDIGQNCPLTSQALEIYTKLCKDGHEARDFSCVFRHYYSGKDEQ
ncbi:probable 3-hydroxyisobutyrate dehydrogenase, mitochondrial isoform X2 [Corylus avellana]|uniref:probable 3-hydroxyisobutyrate dehydrogenase, mitochondrial isoform X2 n=1 Tax=Corylus avellana TaxID=13451 RepID=UPI00286BA600|nr:probable 3-hydroxyisobutyrate dehydrogenase, mitochondrial isoform X2 [Corylus avellana]